MARQFSGLIHEIGARADVGLNEFECSYVYLYVYLYVCIYIYGSSCVCRTSGMVDVPGSPLWMEYSDLGLRLAEIEGFVGHGSGWARGALDRGL